MTIAVGTDRDTRQTFRPRPGDGVDGRGLFGRLNVEWVRLLEASCTRAVVSRWADLHPVLWGTRDLGELLTRLDVASPEESDEILLSLLSLAQHGHQVAGRTVLQAMLPKLARMSSRAWFAAGGEDVHDLFVATLWERIMTYPVARRPRKVAANLALDTLNSVTAPGRRGHGRHEVAVTDQDFDEDLGAPALGARWASAVTSGNAASDEVLSLLLAARRDGLISPEDAALLARVHVSGDSADRIEADLGLSPAGRRQRCSRATRRLAAALSVRT